jgi:prepilin-type N-terminal cleavage/methylation domain-containing protein
LTDPIEHAYHRTVLFLHFEERSCMLKTALTHTLSRMRSQKGFTLIELLVVIGILAVLLAIVLIAINPARQFSQTNDTKRSSDVNAILNAVHQYSASNRGILPPGINEEPTPISTALAAGLVPAGVGQAFCEALVTDYIAALPTDPQVNNGTPVERVDCDDFNTGYMISRSATDSRVTVYAPGTENGATMIQVLR